MSPFTAFCAKAKLFLLILLSYQNPTTGNTVKENLDASGILQFFQTIIRPYFNTLRSSDAIYRANKESSVDEVIKQKLEELKPFLQDNDKVTLDQPEDTNNLTLEGKDETTIIEFIPNKQNGIKNSLRGSKHDNKDLLKMNVNKYMKIRQKIKKALMKEHVSEKTQSFVTTTLDDMIARIIENRCSWESGTQNMKYNPGRAGEPLIFAEEWDEEWRKLKSQYLKYLNDTRSDAYPGHQLFRFFEQFHGFLAHIVKDIQKMAGKYKFSCQVLEKDKTNDVLDIPYPRVGKSKTSESKREHGCEHIKVCSEELKRFMIDFYNALNDTAVSTLRNYASMYLRDVNTDGSQEKGSVITVINNISELVEYKTRKTFIKETSNFELSTSKDINENIRALKNYIKNTVENTKAHIKTNLEAGLKSLRAGLLKTVKQDLTVNVDVDLNNLKRDFKSRICPVFSSCNDQHDTRRNSHHNRKRLGRNSVYVKVQLTFDEELRNKLAEPNSGLKDCVSSETKKKNKHRYEKAHTVYRKTPNDGVDLKDYSMPIVTRTTLSTSTAYRNAGTTNYTWVYSTK